MIWVVNINTNCCRIYTYHKQHGQLTRIIEINEPENKLRSSDLGTDKPGRYKSGESGRGAYEPRTEPKEAEIEQFIRHVAKSLNLARAENKFEQLIIIAPPQVYGLLCNFMDNSVYKKIINHLQKDLIYMKEHELINYLKKHAQYAD